MSRIKYYFDAESFQYVRSKASYWGVVINALLVGTLSLGLGLIMNLLYTHYFQSRRELLLSHQIKDMQTYYVNLDKKLESFNVALSSVEKRDDDIYRVILGAQPIDPTIRKGDVFRLNPYQAQDYSDLYKAEFMRINENIDKLRKKLYIEMISQDELIQISLNKAARYAAIPAIQPISNRKLTAIVSGFGMRIHPVYKVIRMHTGIDFAAPAGTLIYATAAGLVVAADEYDGYGKMVTIDHGFGYTTRYAHMQDFIVHINQKVKRGETIGYVGNTGLSTASHLHYEVLMKGGQIDPVHYFFSDLTPKEYERVIGLATVKNQSLGN